MLFCSEAVKIWRFVMVCVVQNEKEWKPTRLTWLNLLILSNSINFRLTAFLLEKTNVSYSCVLYICEWNSIVGLEFWIELFISG